MKDSKIGIAFKASVILAFGVLIGITFKYVVEHWFVVGAIAVYIAEQSTNPF